MATQRRRASTTLASVAIAVIIALVLGILVAAANGTGPASFMPARPSGSGEMIEVTDSLDRSVSVPASPQHIAATDAFSGNVCVLAGAGEHLMGAPGGVLSNTLLQELSPGLEGLSQLSGSTINIETMLAEGVDVVLMRRSLYEASDEVAKLDKVGIPYVVVDYETVEEQMDAIRLIGQVCGEEASEKAASIADYYATVDELVRDRAAGIPDAEKISVYHSINDPLLTDGATSLGQDWIDRVGAVDVSAYEEATGAQGDYTATLEQIYAWNPDVVICSTAAARDSISSDAKWQGLAAVANGSVFNIPVSTSRWGQRGDPETFLGMLWLAKTLYPDLYEDIDLQNEVVSYYRDIVGLDIDDALWEEILSGEGLRTEGNGSQGIQ